jgi:hypothetical protein
MTVVSARSTGAEAIVVEERMTGSSLAHDVAVALGVHGRRLGELVVPTTEAGCVELHRWALRFATKACYGVAGTPLAWVGLSRYLQASGRLRSEASFAALCGATPLPASSGKTNRHRLNHGGDRQANCALWRIAMSRPTFDQRTQLYARRRTTEGLSKREILRCLKRHIAREE